jgi:hypothetical protein
VGSIPTADIMNEVYVSNNGKGWAIFKSDPNNHRDWAWLDESRKWDKVMATYYPTREKAEQIRQERGL